jgi:hypothetical protein
MSFKKDSAKQISIMQDTLKLFIEIWLSESFGHENATGQDIMLLKELMRSVSMEMKWPELLQRLQDKSGQMVSACNFFRSRLKLTPAKGQFICI